MELPFAVAASPAPLLHHQQEDDESVYLPSETRNAELPQLRSHPHHDEDDETSFWRTPQLPSSSSRVAAPPSSLITSSGTNQSSSSSISPPPPNQQQQSPPPTTSSSSSGLNSNNNNNNHHHNHHHARDVQSFRSLPEDHQYVHVREKVEEMTPRYFHYNTNTNNHHPEDDDDDDDLQAILPRGAPAFLFSSSSSVAPPPHLFNDDEHDPAAASPSHLGADLWSRLLAAELQQQQQQQPPPLSTTTASEPAEGTTTTSLSSLVGSMEQAQHWAQVAQRAKQDGHLPSALDGHAHAAQLLARAAQNLGTHLSPTTRSDPPDPPTPPPYGSMARSLLLLSQSHAKTALALQRILKIRPRAGPDETWPTGRPGPHLATRPAAAAAAAPPILSQRDRLRATVRGALDSTLQQVEADISESVFLGQATRQHGPGHLDDKSTTTANTMTTNPGDPARRPLEMVDMAGRGDPVRRNNNNNNNNPIDDMLELERELQDMDMALELGQSMASLTKVPAMPTLPADAESYLVVPPSTTAAPPSASYMSSSSMWGSGSEVKPRPKHSSNPSAANANPSGVVIKAVHPEGPRSRRANRVQSMLEANASRHGGGGAVSARAAAPLVAPPPTQSLESSWWGHASTTSQVLTSSVISLASHQASTTMDGPLLHSPAPHHQGGFPGSHQQNTQQLLRLMDALKTLGDENAVLLRQVQGAEEARAEAVAAREEIRRFKQEYGQRFAALKQALDQYRKEYPDLARPGDDTALVHPITSSSLGSGHTTTAGGTTTVTNDTALQRQEQLIRKLTADLKKEKEDNKLKDAALRKYETFYKEVKARSAQKAAQKQQERQPPTGRSALASRPPMSR